MRPNPATGERIQEEHRANWSVGKILGIISLVFGILGIIGLIGFFSEFAISIVSNKTVGFELVRYFLQFSFWAMILGGLTYLFAKEKKFSRIGIILGAITFVIMFIIYALAMSAPGS
jgi:hypothetical protein